MTRMAGIFDDTSCFLMLQAMKIDLMEESDKPVVALAAFTTLGSGRKSRAMAILS